MFGPMLWTYCMPVVCNFVVTAQIFKGLWAFDVSFHYVTVQVVWLRKLKNSLFLCVGCMWVVFCLGNFNTLNSVPLVHEAWVVQMLKALFSVISLQSTIDSPLAHIQSILDQLTHLVPHQAFFLQTNKPNNKQTNTGRSMPKCVSVLLSFWPSHSVTSSRLKCK